MKPEFIFQFFVGGDQTPVGPDHDLWTRALPDPSGKASPVSIGDYLDAARRFLSGQDNAALRAGLDGVYSRTAQSGGGKAFKVVSGASPDLSQTPCRVDVSLVKHGAFYHPLKVDVWIDNDRSVAFVLNGAVCEPGLSIIQKEFSLLADLNAAAGSSSCLPRVFCVGDIDTGSGPMGFFLGQWLEGFQEFHLTERDEGMQVVLWGDQGTESLIPLKDAAVIYREAARILSLHYHLETFKQIWPWHHAAGDFVVRLKSDGGFDVRLITVRGYENMTDFEDSGQDLGEMLLPGLLMFFLNMSFRLRLDRFDGTGKPALLGEEFLGEIVSGFLQGLIENRSHDNARQLAEVFVSFLMGFSPAQLVAVVASLLEDMPPNAGDVELVAANIEAHCREVVSVLKAGKKNLFY